MSCLRPRRCVHCYTHYTRKKKHKTENAKQQTSARNFESNAKAAAGWSMQQDAGFGGVGCNSPLQKFKTHDQATIMMVHVDRYNLRHDYCIMHLILLCRPRHDPPSIMLTPSGMIAAHWRTNFVTKIEAKKKTEENQLTLMIYTHEQGGTRLLKQMIETFFIHLCKSSTRWPKILKEQRKLPGIDGVLDNRLIETFSNPNDTKSLKEHIFHQCIANQFI